MDVLAKGDVLVVGGGPAGIGAALAAARHGADTLLLEKHAFLGGIAAFCPGMPINQMRSGSLAGAGSAPICATSTAQRRCASHPASRNCASTTAPCARRRLSATLGQGVTRTSKFTIIRCKKGSLRSQPRLGGASTAPRTGLRADTLSYNTRNTSPSNVEGLGSGTIPPFTSSLCRLQRLAQNA